MKDFSTVEVAILDMDRHTIEALQAALLRIGIHNSRHAGTTVELTQQLEERPADLLFLGDQLPQMPVIETVRALRNLPLTQELPLLWSTQTRNPKALCEQITAGLAGVIWQPTTDTQLRRAVWRALHVDFSRDLISIIKLASFFQEFSLDELREVLSFSLPCRFGPGELIIQRGDPSDSFFVLLQGEVEVFLDEPIATILPGHSFGEMGILETDQRSADCIAAKESTLLEIDSRILLHDQTPTHGKIMGKLATLLASRLRAMNHFFQGERPPSSSTTRQLTLRLHALGQEIPQERQEELLHDILKRWSRPPQHTPLHLVVAAESGEEELQKSFGDLPFSHQIISNPDHKCHGTLLLSQEALSDYLKGVAVETGIESDFSGPLTHTGEDPYDHTLFLVDEGPEGKMAQAIQERFPHAFLITKDHFSLFAYVALLTELGPPIRASEPIPLEATFGIEG